MVESASAVYIVIGFKEKPTPHGATYFIMSHIVLDKR